MLRIIPELNQAFNTRERAPFKFVCEVIKLRELQEQDIKIRKQDNIFNKSPKSSTEKNNLSIEEKNLQSPKQITCLDLIDEKVS